MKLTIDISDDKIETFLKSVMQNMPEYSLSLTCTSWRYDDMIFKFVDTEDGKNYTVFMKDLKKGFEKIAHDMFEMASLQDTARCWATTGWMILTGTQAYLTAWSNIQFLEKNVTADKRRYMKRTCVCGASIEHPDWDAMMSMDSLLKMQASGLDPVFNFELRHKDCKAQPTPEIIDYEIINLQWQSSVVEAVKKMMAEGWKPWGNLLVTTSYEERTQYGNTSHEYSQAMVKYK